MNYEQLGRDEQESAGLFIRWISPTDFDKLQKSIAQTIADKYAWDLINPKLIALLGFDSGNVALFIREYMRIAETNKQYLHNDATYAMFFSAMQRDTTFSDSDLGEFLPALMELVKQGNVPPAILKPYDYEATSLASDIAGTAVKSILPLGTIALLAFGAYAFMSGGFSKVPELFSGKA